MQQGFAGMYTVVMTPFTNRGEDVDVVALADFLEWQVESGVPGVIVLGTAGEFVAVSDAERDRLIAAAVGAVRGRIPVLAGTAATATAEAVDRSRRAQAQGVDGLMVLPPYYYPHTDDEIYSYFGAISEAVSVPIMLYNNAFTTKVDISASLVARIAAAFPSVAYMKEGSGDVARVREVVEATEGRVSVFGGERVIDSQLLGASGFVSHYGNFIPRASNWMWNLLEQGRLGEASALGRRIADLDQVLSRGHPTVGHLCCVKALAGAVGRPLGEPRAPLTALAQLGGEGRAIVDEAVSLATDLEQEAQAQMHFKPQGNGDS